MSRASRDTDEPVQIYEAWNTWQAQMLIDLLADAGINARLASNAVENLVGDVPFQRATCPVWVDKRDADRARSMVSDFERRLSRRSMINDSTESICYHCGALVEPRQSPCPSCGSELDWSP